jgi:hypothetical protein
VKPVRCASYLIFFTFSFIPCPLSFRFVPVVPVYQRRGAGSGVWASALTVPVVPAWWRGVGSLIRTFPRSIPYRCQTWETAESVRFRALSLAAFGPGLFTTESNVLRHQRLSCVTNNIQNPSIVIQTNTPFPDRRDQQTIKFSNIARSRELRGSLV